MTTESLSATTTIDAPAEKIFAVLADPTQHSAIDGTGWVCEAIDTDPLSEAGQTFRMNMYHPNHPNGSYQMFNLIEVFDAPRAISWKPGYDSGDGSVGYGGWVWRYDLVPTDAAKTKVTLSYDWSAVPESVREHIGFPPFPTDHLINSLVHLAELVG